MDVVVIMGIDAARVALAAGLEDLPNLVEGLIEPVVLEDGEHDPKLFRRKPVRLADVLLLDHEEGLVIWDRQTGAPGHDRRRPGNRIGGAMSVGIPVRLLE